MKKVILITLILVFGTSAMSVAQQDATIDPANIRYWIGEGENEVVVAISWCSYTETALAWGYRFNGEATVFQALTDIAAADSRLTVIGSAPTNVTYVDEEYNLTMCPNPDAEWGDPDYDIPMHSVNGLMGMNMMSAEPIHNNDFIKIGGVTCGVMSADWTTISWSTEIIPATDPNAGEEVVDATISADEIKYWVGEGENEVVVAISWCSYTETALAWGYRFDDEATVFQALTDIAAADSRLTVIGSAPTNVTYVDEGYNLTMCPNPDAEWGDPDYDVPMHSVNGFMGMNIMSSEPIHNGDFVKIGGVACGIMSADWTTITWEQPIEPVSINNAAVITVSANPANGGTVTGGGNYQQGQSCTVSASPNANYSFTNWTENSSVVSTNANYTFPVNSNRNLVANFNPIAHEYTVTADTDPAEGGTVMGAGTYEEGATCMLTAIPNEDYVFENWTRNGNVISDENPYSFSVSRDITLVAHFRQDASHFTIIAKAEPIEGGLASGGGTFELGETCHLNTIANDGYEFVNWTLNGIEVSTDPSCNFPVTGNATYVAHFRRAVNHYTITVSIEPTDAGSVLGAGPYEEEASCTLIAMSNPTYSFVGWMENGVVVYTESPYSFRVDRNRTLVAVFSQGLFYTISASAGPNGIISPSGDVRVMPGEDQTFTLIPDNGCSVSRVIVDGIDRGAEPSHTFRNVNEDHTIYVQFSGLGVDDHIAPNLKLYPNPAQDKINIESPNMKHIAVFNLLGVQIESKDVNDDYAVISTNEFPQGTYILKVEYLDESVGYSRFVVAK